MLINLHTHQDQQLMVSIVMKHSIKKLMQHWGDYQHNIGNNKWALYNAVTHWISHPIDVKNKHKTTVERNSKLLSYMNRPNSMFYMKEVTEQSNTMEVNNDNIRFQKTRVIYLQINRKVLLHHLSIDLSILTWQHLE